jgi:hypothetical protein
MMLQFFINCVVVVVVSDLWIHCCINELGSDDKLKLIKLLFSLYEIIGFNIN